MYLTITRPDICFNVNTLSQYMVEPRHVHLVAAKHVMRYLEGILGYILTYATDREFKLCGYTDLEWEGSIEDRKITLGSCFSLGSCVISWLVESILVFHSMQQRLNTLQHVQPVVKQYVFPNY